MSSDSETETVTSKRGYKEYNDWREYERPIETIQDKINEDVDETIQSWLDDGYTEMNPDKILSDLKPQDNIKVRYVTKDMLCRKGGVLTGVINDNGQQFLRIKNHIANVCWSVQLKNIEMVFWKKIGPKSTNKRFSDVETVLVVEAITEARETLKTVNADRIYTYIKENKMLNVPRTYIRNYMRNEKIN